jgi:hypothetical protein
MTFFIEVVDSYTYTSIMEVLISSSLTHTKEQIGGTTRLEIQGSEKDYRVFENIIEQGNKSRGGIVARIIEGI